MVFDGHVRQPGQGAAPLCPYDGVGVAGYGFCNAAGAVSADSAVKLARRVDRPVRARTGGVADEFCTNC